MERVDHVVSSIINARLHDLGYKVSVAVSLPLLGISGISKAEEKVAKTIQKLIEAESTDPKDMQAAKAIAEREAKSFLQIDSRIDELEELGASEAELKGLRKFRTKLQKKVFKKLDITEELIAEVRGAGNE